MPMESVTKSFVERLGNVPSHQQVGKNGSFWLPSELKNEAFSKNLKAADSKFGKKILPKSESKGKTCEPLQNAARNSTQGKLNSVSNSNLPPKNSFVNAQVTGSSKFTQAKIFFTRIVPVQTAVLPKLDKLNNHNHSLPVNHPVKSNLKDLWTQSTILKSEVNPDADREVFDNRRNPSHGIKSAYSQSDMEVSFNTQLSLELAGRELTSVSKESNPQARTLLEFAGKEIIPRIAYFAKHDKKVVRFAMDLPNGSKLGVRLEKSKDRFNLCFISSDDHSQKMLEQLKSILGKFSDGESSAGEFRVFHFQNYKEMDDYFHQAA